MKNINTPIQVCFFNLDRYEPHPGELSHKSICPQCKEGLLLMCRDFNGMLLALDCCTACGQRFIYTDIDRIREELL